MYGIVWDLSMMKMIWNKGCNLLVLNRTELILFRVASMGPCLGYMLNSVDNTGIYLAAGWS